MKRISALLGGAVLGVAALAACGGGGGGSGTSSPNGALPPSGPTSAPQSGPPAFTASNAVAIPTPAPGATTVPVPLPSDPGGASGTLAIPASASVPADATVAAVYSTSSDGTVPALGARRAVASVRGARDDSRNVIAYLRLQFSADVSLPQAPAFTFIVPGTLPTSGVTYWLALIDPLQSAAGWQLGFEGPAVVSAAQTSSGATGTQIAFASNGKPLTFAANQVYYFAVYSVSATAATPTPVPSSVPTNPPPQAKPAPVVASPPNVQFTSVTASSPVPVTFSQQGFTGTFKLSGDCTGILNTSGASPTWTLTPVGQGRCVIVGLGDKGATAVVHVGVVTPYETPGSNASPTPSPTGAPTHEPTNAPTASPSPEASRSPKPTPTASPTASPTTSPTHEPTSSPTTSPSPEASRSPKPTPTASPTASPAPGSNAQ
ncbi:MAG TPA: hypothetical protein VHT53_10660 [Candidatus Elarobacter sp.]|nr:hypothetical protein [Candidatus Elarobacter sp.]